ncbi:MAG: hypothetical protein ACREQR_00590 [Candidatus Binataceae bacterium]
MAELFSLMRARNLWKTECVDYPQANHWVTRTASRRFCIPNNLCSLRIAPAPRGVSPRNSANLATSPMPLTNAQIDRYSRQIIVPRVGGRAQQRVLAARIVIAAAYSDLEPALAYLVGAGVGRIELALADRCADFDKLAAAMRSLNPDSAVARFAPDDSSHGAPDLVFAIVSGSGSQSSTHALCTSFVRIPSVIARLDSPPRIGVFPVPPPCAICAADLLAQPFGELSTGCGFVTMAATAEVFKLLAAYDAAPRAAMIEFDGYNSRTHEPVRDPNCACASAPA